MALVDKEFNGDCCMCGEKAVAFWMCSNPIYICRFCGIDKLPLLIGDVIASAPGVYSKTSLDDTVRRSTSQIWRAIALQAMSERRVRKPVETDGEA